MTLNQEIRKRRIAKGISIRRLAELTGLSATTIVNFENGSGARMEKVMAMIDAIGCRVVIIDKQPKTFEQYGEITFIIVGFDAICLLLANQLQTELSKINQSQFSHTFKTIRLKKIFKCIVKNQS